MNWRLPFLLLFCCAFAFACSIGEEPKKGPPAKIAVNAAGPDFTLKDLKGQEVSLGSYRDRPVLLVSFRRERRRSWRFSISTSMSRRPRSPISHQNTNSLILFCSTKTARWPSATRYAESRRLFSWTGRGKSCAISAGTSMPCSKVCEVLGSRRKVRGSRG
jgi:hypothetical protein